MNKLEDESAQPTTADQDGMNQEGGRKAETITDDQHVVINFEDLEVGNEITVILDVITKNDLIPVNLGDEVSGNQPNDDGLLMDITENNISSDISDNMILESSEFEEEETEVKKARSRKRTVKKKNWKSEIRKRQRQRGHEYEDRKGKVHRKRTIQGQCKGTCKFECTKKISRDDCNVIHKQFWTLSDSGKNHFYSKFVDRHIKKRSRTGANNNRKYSYFYYLGTQSETRLRVCKEFFFKTLDISQRRIYWFFEHAYDEQTGIGRSPVKGSKTISNIENYRKDKVRQHINSFNRVPSHYCRKDSSKEYLEATLTLAEMYRLYKETNTENPVTESLYRSIFNSEFNLDFHKPKKDRCDTCEAFKANLNPSPEEVQRYDNHQKEKDVVKTMRDGDRNIAIKALDNTNTCIVAFDLENVFPLPKAEVSNFFYKRKLNCYNLTAHSTYKGQIQQYCLVWHELISGRAGNNLASTVYKFLEDILAKNDGIKRFILWSDSCVPQNKNSIMSFAIQTFLKKHPSVEEIIQRFSEPGHGVVQEVDAIHSKIERWLKNMEIFSPLSLVRLLVHKATKDNTSITVIQMLEKDFFDYQTPAKTLNYSLIPYTKVKEIALHNSNLFTVKFRTSFTEEKPTEINLVCKDTPRKQDKKQADKKKKASTTSRQNLPKKSKQQDTSKKTSSTTSVPKTPEIPAAKPIYAKPVISLEKKKDIQSMEKYMPEIDKQFYNALFFSKLNK